MTLHIRPGTPNDLPAILSLIRLLAEFDGSPAALKAAEDDLRMAWFSEAPLGGVLIAEWDGEIVAIATHYTTFSTFQGRAGLWLDDLFVHESHRSRGIGEALIRHLATMGRDRGYARIEWTVALDNDRGIAFYERLGATVSQRTRCVRLDREAIERLSTEAYETGS
jgi:GNAT superfamily N-acetyltransferase